MDNIQFKDVAHLYFGCKLFDTADEFYSHIVVFDYNFLSGKDFIFTRAKPILRPLSNLSQDEADVLGYTDRDEFLEMIDETDPCWRLSVTDYVYLLSRHFDLFSLIKSGQAIDATTLKSKPYKHEK